MNVIGLIAEYNPFHNGHLYQINKIKEIYKDSIIIVVVNGNFTQRGDISIINKWDKAKILLNHNIDLVIELPTFYGINNADIFSKGAIEILNELKIDTLVFGTERDNINDFYKLIECKKTNEYTTLLKDNLNKGYSYPKSSFDALKMLTTIELNTPNDILAMSYIEEINKNNYNIKPFLIKRTNNYHSTKLEQISSATSIREALKNNIDISKYVPNDVLKYVNNISLDNYFDLLKYKIISTDDLTIFHDVKEGIDSRIKKYINESNTLEELINLVKTKRYTYNRIKRILLYILLDIRKDIKISNYVRPLGFNNKGSKYLKSIKDKIKLPIVTNYSDNKSLLSLEYKANSIYSLRGNTVINDELNKPIKK